MGHSEKTDKIRGIKLDKYLGSAIDKDQAIVLNTELVLRSLEKTNIPDDDGIRHILNNILHLAAENAISVREMRNLEKQFHSS